MFKSTIYTAFALAMALSTLAAPAAVPDAKTTLPVSNLCFASMMLANMYQLSWGETGGLGTGGEGLK
jgi:hypothetical protein